MYRILSTISHFLLCYIWYTCTLFKVRVASKILTHRINTTNQKRKMTSLAKTLLLLALLAACMSAMSNACFLSEKVHVRITNQLENGEDLTLHCNSGDNDLGEHFLHKDENYKFSFCTNVFDKTLYYCSFAWSGQVRWFDVYAGVRYNCLNCNWRITHSGPCLEPDTPDAQETCYQYRKK